MEAERNIKSAAANKQELKEVVLKLSMGFKVSRPESAGQKLGTEAVNRKHTMDISMLDRFQLNTETCPPLAA